MMRPPWFIALRTEEAVLDAAETNSEPLRSNGTPPAIEEELGVLRAQLRTLERRVAQIEQQGRSQPAAIPISVPLSPTEAPPDRVIVSNDTSSALSKGSSSGISGGVATFGRALLGIAGAYLLRALTELGFLSMPAGAAAGIAYAMAWLWFSTRTVERVPAAVYASTSFFILGPLVWETTTRFHVVSTSTAAAVVAGFSLAAQAMVWQKGSRRTQFRIVAGIAPFACAAISLFLLIGTRDLIPFAFSLLAIAAGVETTVLAGGAPGTRWVVAGIVDLAFVSLTWVLTRDGLPPGYAPAPFAAIAAAQIGLVLIYVSAEVLDTLLRAQPFGIVRILQTVAALALGLGGFYGMGRSYPGVPMATGLAALLGAVGFYAISFAGRGAPSEEMVVRSRNASAYGWFGFALTIAAGFILLPGTGRVLCWATLAILAAFAPKALNWTSLQLQESGFLFLASASSGAWEAARLQLFTAESPQFPAIVTALLAIATVLCYLPMHAMRETSLKQRGSIVMAAANLVWLVEGAVSHALVGFWRVSGIGASVPASTIATAVLICLTLAIAWCGILWNRRELIWVVYAAMAVGAIKLATMDFAFAATLPLVVSLLFYGGGLMLLPKILARRTLHAG